MNILLAGANGQVGRETALLLSGNGFFVTAAGHAQCDITNSKSIQYALRENNFELIINCAAYTAVDKAEQDQAAAMQINAEGSRHLALAASAAGIPLLHISTDYVFDGQSQSPYREDAAANPLNMYGKSKLAGEEYIRVLMTDYIILRTSWVFGRYGNNFVKTMLRLGRERDELRIIDDQYGCPTAAQDIANAVHAITCKINAGTARYGIYHYCGKPVVSWYGFAEKIFSIAKDYDLPSPALVPIATDEYPLPAQRPKYSVLDCAKIYSDYAINQPSWDAALENVIREVLQEQPS